MRGIEGEDKLPSEWCWTVLEEIADINPRFDRKRAEEDLEATFLPMRCVEEISGHLDLSLTRKTGEVMKGYTHFSEGDVLFAKITPCMENGKVAVARRLKNGIGFGSTEFHVIRPRDGLPPGFLFFYLIQEGIRKEAKMHMTGSVGQLRVPTGYIRRMPIPLPPIPEQHRIIAKIEELFTKLDAGVESLKSARAQLKQYGQAVLKAAVEGKLSRKWLETHKGEIEPASALLEGSLSERREEWEAAKLSKYEARKSTPPHKWRQAYKEPSVPDTSELPELPSGWVWASIKQLSTNVRYGSSTKASVEPSGVPVLRMGNIENGRLVLDDLKYLPENHKEFPGLLLESGDLLFNRTNSRELVGKTSVYNGVPSPCSFASYLIRVRFAKGVSPWFICHFINSAYGKRWILSVTSQQVGQANVNGTKLQALVVPLPPAEEQTVIVEVMDRHLSIIQSAQSLMERNLRHSEGMRQSILRQAYSGELVRQNPGDEPANALLERIKKQREGHGSKNAKGRPSQAKIDVFQIS